MKLTRREFLANLARTAIAVTAGLTMTGVRVETPAPELEDWDRLESTILRTQVSLEQLAMKMERAAMTIKNGLAVWRVPLDERTLAPELDGMPVILTGEAVPATVQVEVYRVPVEEVSSP